MTDKQLDSFEFDLTVPIEVYQNINGKNDMVKCKKLYLKAPTSEHKHNTRTLKQMFLRTMANLSQNDRNKTQPQTKISSEDEDEKLDSKSIKAILLLGDCNINDYINEFQKFVTNRIAFTDENCKYVLNSTYFNKLSEEDIENLIGAYLENFFTVSWLRSLT